MVDTKKSRLCGEVLLSKILIQYFTVKCQLETPQPVQLYLYFSDVRNIHN